MSGLTIHFRKFFALYAIGAIFAWALITVSLHRRAEAPPGAITLRIGHWQLEASVREALEEAGRAYREQVNPNVYIVQDAIPEMTYAQWATTQLMGGTAPDIMECGAMLPPPMWIQYYNRYFIPLTRYVNQPNPYNHGTSLEGVPLRSTYKDGMRNSYIEELQEFMLVPLSQFGIRIFYNRDLLRQLTGLDEAPHEYRAFLAVCETIKNQLDESGRPYTAIAGSKYHIGMWESMMCDPLSYGLYRDADFNRDGMVGNDENYVAFKTGRLTFEHPALRARFQMLGEITRYFQTGYTGLTRDEAVMLFAQKRAVFMTTGTWDARSLEEQARGVFTVGVMDFPMPTKDDPVYGKVVEGPIYERPSGGFPFGITRTSKHPEVALDFLLFLASRDRNEALNKTIGWIPAVRDTRMDPLLEAFAPHLNGVYSCMNLSLGGETLIRYTQLYSLLLVHQITYEEFARQYTPFYLESGLKDFNDQQRDWRRALQINETFLAGIRALALTLPPEEARAWWVKYRSQTGTRQVNPEIVHVRQRKLVAGSLKLPETGPYAYSDAVLARVRARVTAAAPAANTPSAAPPL